MYFLDKGDTWHQYTLTAYNENYINYIHQMNKTSSSCAGCIFQPTVKRREASGRHLLLAEAFEILTKSTDGSFQNGIASVEQNFTRFFVPGKLFWYPPKSSKIQAYPSHLSQKSSQDVTKSDSKIGVQLYLFQNQSFHASNGSLTGLLSSDAAELHFVPPPGNRRKTRQARLKSHGEMDETIVTMILNYS